MSYERILKIEKSVSSLNRVLLDFFKNIGNTEVLSVDVLDSNCEILLRFLNVEKREKWPEDIKATFSADEIYLCFYSGNLNVQEEIFNQLIMILKKLSVSFVEEED